MCQLYTAINAATHSCIHHVSVWSMNRISMKALHFGDSTTIIGLLVCRYVHPIVQGPATARHVEKPVPGQSHSTRSGHHTGQTEDFRDVKVVHVLAELQESYSTFLRPQRFFHRTVLWKCHFNSGSLKFLEMLSCSKSLQHAFSRHVCVRRLWSTIRTNLQIHISANRCATWQNLGLSSRS